MFFLHPLGTKHRKPRYVPAIDKKNVSWNMNSDQKTSRAQQEIDQNLKRAYGDVIKQDVPDRFTDLLAQLRAAEAGKPPSNDGSSNADA